MKSDSPTLKIEDQLCFALYAASLSMSKAYKPYLEAVGLTYPQYLVMLVLWENEHQSVSEIGEQLFLDSGTLTPLLKRLEASAYVKRTRDATDERRVIVSLTAKGKALKKKILPLPRKMLKATQCSMGDAKQLVKVLGDLRVNLLDSLNQQDT